jgi:hypothetical protein
MAIAPSKLGRFIRDSFLEPLASGAVLLRKLREVGLVKPDAPDDELEAEFERIRMTEKKGRRASAVSGRSPRPRVRGHGVDPEYLRVWLAPYLSDKGRAWAVPLASLDLPDE